MLDQEKPKKTPLYEAHVKLGAKMVDFAGWLMPIQYLGLKEEHLQTRSHGGLFDVSHMGEIRFRGPKALESLEWLTTNHVGRLKENEAQYSMLMNNEGGLVDDIIVYCLKPNEDYLVCVNASNKDKDFEWMKKNNKGALIEDESAFWGQIAVQGLQAKGLIEEVLNFDLSLLKPFQLYRMTWNNSEIIIASTGYTGEKGCEIFVPSANTEKLWNQLISKGDPIGVKPVGLGARDTLRTEMKYSLYGHEIDHTTNPIEAGLGWAVKPDKKDFLGKSDVLKAKEKGVSRGLVGFKMKDKGIPRQGYKLLDDSGADAGIVTSGTHSPSLDEPIGIGYLRHDLTVEGTEFFVDIRGRKVKAQVVKTPFVKTSLTK